MLEWTVIDIIIIAAQMLLAGFYKSFVASKRKLKFSIRCTLNRLFVLGAIGIFLMERLGVFGERYSIVFFGIGVFWFTLLFATMLFSDGWCCDKCGRRIGIKVLYINKCPFCDRL